MQHAITGLPGIRDCSPATHTNPVDIHTDAPMLREERGLKKQSQNPESPPGVFDPLQRDVVGRFALLLGDLRNIGEKRVVEVSGVSNFIGVTVSWFFLEGAHRCLDRNGGVSTIGLVSFDWS